MKMKSFSAITFLVLVALVLLAGAGVPALAQSTATLQGTVLDAQGGTVPNATVTVKNKATGNERKAQTDSTGNFQVAALPPGTYRVEIKHEGFQTLVANDITLDVASTVTQNFALKVGEVSLTVEVTSTSPLVESSTMTVGQVIDQKTVQEIPLNGRHFVDLGLLIPGSVTPPQNGFLTAPLRGQGSFAFNTAGNREDSVNFMINGINLNDMVQNQITFQPSINTVSEFKVDNSTYSAEYGRNSGAIVNIATRSGSNQFHGEAFEFLRNEALDARNFFAPAFDSKGNFIPKGAFKRNQFGASVGGPVWKDNTFFFFSYEGLRQRQGITINGGVLSDAQRAGVTDPAALKLISLVPKANAADSKGNPIFVGSATAPVNIDQWTTDLSHNIGQKDRLHGYYAFQRDLRQEPVLQGNTIPGFGDTRQSHRQIFTLNETHLFSANVANEARLGFNRIHITFTPNAQLNPTDFGINDGVPIAIGLPQFSFDDISLNFGGPAGFPQGRGDLTAAFSDSLSWQHGHHGIKLGTEIRRFYNNNFNLDIGRFIFSSVGNFQTGNARQFSITLGNGASKIVESAWGMFAQDSYKVWSNFTLELGMRYDINFSPTDSQNRFVLFVPGASNVGSLVQVGAGVNRVYPTDNKNFQPRVGFAWDPFKTGKTSVRGGFAIQMDQPVTNMVTPTTNNPPFGLPFTLTSSSNAITFSPAINPSNPSSVAPASVDPSFTNSYVQSWNLNIEREIKSSLGVTLGYFGSKGTHLRLSRNINEFVSGARPFTKLSGSSPILPNTALGNITQISSEGNSSYNALWVTANKRLSHGLQFNASYTYSKSIDYNSLNSQGVIIQDSFNIRNDRGLSDFDARHRFVVNALYELPFKGNRLVAGWQLGVITQWQTGNPFTVLAGNTPACPKAPAPPTAGCGGPANNSFTGLATIRPDLTGPVTILGDPAQWFTTTVCNPFSNPTAGAAPCAAGSAFTLPMSSSGAYHFGSLGRNTFTGPGFSNTDFSVIKNTRITESMKIQFRAEMFDVFNHPNFGQPGRTAQPGSTSFGVITNTRFPNGDSGSSRQVQFALKFIF